MNKNIRFETDQLLHAVSFRSDTYTLRVDPLDVHPPKLTLIINGPYTYVQLLILFFLLVLRLHLPYYSF